MNHRFEWAVGSIIGRDHRTFSWTNNQDAYAIVDDPGFLCAVVCDGCGGAAGRSEIGAWLGAHLIARQIAERERYRLRQGWSSPVFAEELHCFWEEIRSTALAELRTIIGRLGDRASDIAADHFCFTVLGCLINEAVASFVSIGDGLVVVNNEAHRIGPFPDNAPPYLAYGWHEFHWREPSGKQIAPSSAEFRPILSVATDRLESCLLGTDGLAALRKTELAQFCEEDRYFKNPFAVGRKLRLLNQDEQPIDWERGIVEVIPGRLQDDTTLVAIRRRKEG